MDVVFTSFLFLVMILVSLFGCLIFGIILIGIGTGTIKFRRWEVDVLNGIIMRLWVFIFWLTAQTVSTYAFYSAYSKF